ncbi:MAG: SGNH/GDSL hydrolase family protein [Trichodesmium sp. MAG_R01]|nr:SGNH/GDSL hydrolase family protein [Trichodesmium sp. MAG_R01]
MENLAEKINKLQNFVVNLGIIIATFTFVVIVGEIGLRIAGIEHLPPPRTDEKSESKSLYTSKDPNRGWAGNSNATAFWTGEGIPSELKMNSGGFRDYERSKNKPENGLRIALLGDSFTEAVHVKLEDTYGAIIEQNLQQCPDFKDQKVEVMNFGVQGYGTAQELMTLRHHVWDYSPDLVILAFYAGNDIRNNYRPLDHDHLRPYFVYKNGQLELDMSFRTMKPWERGRYVFSMVDILPIWLVRNSRILQLIRKVDMDYKQSQFLNYNGQTIISFYREPESNSDWDKGWQVTEGLITLMRDEVYKNRADFMVIAISDSHQVHPDLEYREKFKNAHNLSDLYYPDRRIEAFGKQENIPVYILAGQLGDKAKKTGKCLYGFDNGEPCGGHWNIEGHKFVGEVMSHYLCDQYKLKRYSSSK